MSNLYAINVIDYAKFYSRSHDAVIRVFDDAGNAFAAALAGCATADFTPYVGAQQNWPTAHGAFVASQYAVPAYCGYPPRPYIVLGYLDATAAPVRRSRMSPNLATPPGATFAQWRE